jgi:hypothetical protein
VSRASTHRSAEIRFVGLKHSPHEYSSADPRGNRSAGTPIENNVSLRGIRDDANHRQGLLVRGVPLNYLPATHGHHHLAPSSERGGVRKLVPFHGKEASW